MQRYSSTWSKFVQTSIAFHQNLSKEGRSMMLEDHRSSAQFCQRQISNTYFRQILNFSQIPKKSSYPKCLQPPRVIVALTDGLEN